MRIEVGPGESIERALTRAHEQAREEDGMAGAEQTQWGEPDVISGSLEAERPCAKCGLPCRNHYEGGPCSYERPLREQIVDLEAEIGRLRAERDAAWRVRDAGWEQTENALKRMRQAEAERDEARSERRRAEHLWEITEARLAEHLAAHRTADAHDCAEMEEENARLRGRLAKVVEILHLPLQDRDYFKQATRAHTIDVVIRKDGKEYRHQGDFLKELLTYLAAVQPEESHNQRMESDDDE